MRASVWFVAFGLALATAVAAQQAAFENDHYAVVVSRAGGGLIESLQAKGTGEPLVRHMRIYTDYGIYPDRAYVGTSEKSAATFDARRQGEALITTAQGQLLGKPAEGRKPIAYRVQMRFDSSPGIHVKAAVQPAMTKEQVRGFMALCWAIPSLTRWRLRTIEGLLRHTYHPGEGAQGRAYSRQWPLDPVRPLIAASTTQGVELRLENLRWSGTPSFTGPVIHGQTLFLCWLDGTPRDLQAGTWATLEFDLRVAAPARSRD